MILYKTKSSGGDSNIVVVKTLPSRKFRHFKGESPKHFAKCIDCYSVTLKKHTLYVCNKI